MIVVLDTNAIFSDWELRKPNFQLLSKYGDLSQQLDIIIPNIIFQESIALYKKNIHGHFRSAAKTIALLRGLLPSSYSLPVFQVDQDSNFAASEYGKRLEKRIREVGQILRHDDIPAQVLLDRCLSRKAPFKKEGQEFRDALIWEVILQKIATNDDTTFLVTRNHRDFAKDNELHPDLVNDLEDRGLSPSSVQLIDTVDTLVDRHIKPHLHSTNALPGLQDGSHKDFNLIGWFKETREEIINSIDSETFFSNFSFLPVEEPKINYIEDPSSVHVNHLLELDNERVFIEANFQLETIFQFFIEKFEYYLRDRPPIEIEDSDWNESYMVGALTLDLPIDTTIVYNARSRKVESFGVDLPEIFGICNNCAEPILADTAESCTNCGRQFS